MAKKTGRRYSQKRDEEEGTPDFRAPWLSSKTGLRVITVLSLGMVAYITWQLQPSEGFIRALLWGLGFGASIWGIFGLSYAFNRWVRRR